MTASVIARVAALKTTPTPALKAMWRDLFETEPPPYNRRFLESDPAKRRRGTDRPIAGTRLIREWQGVEHCATVRDDGYEYQGRPYKSLSAIARAIAGTRWNGWVFFGLKNQRARP